MAPLIYLLGELISSLAWTQPDYHYLSNFISDLGVPIITRAIDSPLYYVMNTGFVLYGILFILAIYLLKGLFTKHNNFIFSLASIEGLGIILVGFFPGYQWWGAVFHGIGATMAIVGGNVFLILIGKFIAQQARSKKFTYFSYLLGAIGLLSFIICLLITSMTEYAATFERLSVYTIMLWDFVLAGYLIRKIS
ncbi:DUF998 domain-containing protein [Weissella hellenica]|uniref:DUF998 domain-containing protein n=2 Tax=Weissella hellenica TaxID=46256 RepID=A0A7X6RD32_WEIHE|nr:DUF998 domain-containing protein [Weissella hellenica]NKY67247.1 DUF998 domain-containing protein [Weissella hellenica]